MIRNQVTIILKTNKNQIPPFIIYSTKTQASYNLRNNLELETGQVSRKQSPKHCPGRRFLHRWRWLLGVQTVESGSNGFRFWRWKRGLQQKRDGYDEQQWKFVEFHVWAWAVTKHKFVYGFTANEAAYPWMMSRNLIVGNFKKVDCGRCSSVLSTVIASSSSAVFLTIFRYYIQKNCVKY